VEITTAEDAVPLRAWLDPSLGYIGTARAKNKIQSWFRSLPLRVSIADGREQLSTMMDRLGVAALNDEELDALSAAFGLTTQDDLFRAVAVADIQVLDVVLQQFSNGEDSSGQLSLLPELSIAQSRQSHTLEIRARNRDGLLRDVTQLLSDDKHSLISTTGRVDMTTDTALLVIELQLANLFEVAKVINRLQHIENVIAVRRLTRAGVGDR
jgi:(p)ppGpp synthase/HD superfamily hydrolase